MSIRRKLKSLLRLRSKRHGHHDPKPFSPLSLATRNIVTSLYQHPNMPIRPAKPHIRPKFVDIRESLEFIYKPYITPSEVVIPPDFSYDHPKVYEVSGPLPKDYLRHFEIDDIESMGTPMESDNTDSMGMQMENNHNASDGDDDRFGDGDTATMASEFSFNNLSRMIEIALLAHDTGNHSILREVLPRPLPVIPGQRNANPRPTRRSIRILARTAMRKAEFGSRAVGLNARGSFGS